jgi:ABC-type multidrug transport system fused ATPase/permease subunit
MDAIIQRTLKSQLGADVTVITIAHRLRTIMDADKIVRCDVSCI